MERQLWRTCMRHGLSCRRFIKTQKICITILVRELLLLFSPTHRSFVLLVGIMQFLAFSMVCFRKLMNTGISKLIFRFAKNILDSTLFQSAFLYAIRGFYDTSETRSNWNSNLFQQAKHECMAKGIVKGFSLTFFMPRIRLLVYIFLVRILCHWRVYCGNLFCGGDYLRLLVFGGWEDVQVSGGQPCVFQLYQLWSYLKFRVPV